MQLEHDRRAQENTAKDVYMEPEFCKKYPHVEKKVREILAEFPDVFRNVVGKVPDKYRIHPTFTQEMNQMSIMKQRERPDPERRATIKKLELEFQDQILVFPEDHNVVVTNQIPLLPVAKRDDCGNVIPSD